VQTGHSGLCTEGGESVDTLRPILALVLLTAVAWIAVYTVFSGFLKLIRWPSRFNLEDRFPPHRARKINRNIASVVGLIVAGILLYYCAPATMQSLKKEAPHVEMSHIQVMAEGKPASQHLSLRAGPGLRRGNLSSVLLPVVHSARSSNLFGAEAAPDPPPHPTPPNIHPIPSN